jgi:DNA-directed RNA polymerase specialized sigma24 family protein
VKAIAESLGMSEKAVQNNLYRGKLSLRRKLTGIEMSKYYRNKKRLKEDCEVIIYG